MIKKLTLAVLGLVVFSMLLAPLAQAAVYVRGYYRSDGTYVQGHYRSSPDGNPYNNYSYPGNTNPYTGETATGNPDTYLQNYPGYSNPPIRLPISTYVPLRNHTLECQRDYGTNVYGTFLDSQRSNCYCNTGFQWNIAKTACAAIPQPDMPTAVEYRAYQEQIAALLAQIQALTEQLNARKAFQSVVP